MLEQLLCIESTLLELLNCSCDSVDLTPVLLSGDAHERTQQRTSLHSLAHELDSTLSLIHSAQSKLASLHHSVASRRASLTNALSPASSLPTELARHIFMLSISSGLSDSLHTRLAISQTCSYWRTVTLALPEFWQSIVLNAAQAKLFEHLRLRSYPLPMWLRIEDRPRRWRDALLGRPETVEALTEEMNNAFAPPQPSRLVSLRIEDNGRFNFPMFFGDSLLPIHMDTLQVFSSETHSHPLSAMFSPRTIVPNALHFHRAWIDPIHLDVNQLVKLSLVDIPLGSISRLIQMAADCPALEILHLERIRRSSRHPTPPVAPIFLLPLVPWLSLDIRTLGIVNCDEDVWIGLFALQTFRLPKLISFALEHRGSGADDVDDEGMGGGVRNWANTPEMFRAFMSSSPYLENISLIVNAEDLPPLLISLLIGGGGPPAAADPDEPPNPHAPAPSHPAPSLSNLELVAPHSSSSGLGAMRWLPAASVKSVVRERSLRVGERVNGVAGLKRLVISRSLLDLEEGGEEWYVGAVEEGGLIIVDDDVLVDGQIGEGVGEGEGADILEVERDLEEVGERFD